jgi:type I restriction enzyme, R subunit
MLTANQNPEQIAQDRFDAALVQAGWLIQNKSSINLAAAVGVAARDYQTNVGLTDYILFVNKKRVGVIEAKREEEGIHVTVHEDQTEDYAKAKLRVIHTNPFVFLCESTGEVTPLLTILTLCDKNLDEHAEQEF